MEGEAACFLAGTILFGLGIILLLTLSWSKATTYYSVYVQHSAAVQILWLSFTLYVLLLQDQSFLLRADGARVYWIRYLIYTLSFGITAQRLGLISGLPKDISASFSKFILFGFALIAWATVVPFAGRWTWYGLGVAAIIMGTIKIYVNCMRNEQIEIHHLRIYAPMLWILYPIVWGFGSAGADMMSPFLEILIYLIMDAFTFFLFNGNLHVYSEIISEAKTPTVKGHFKSTDSARINFK